ncbi:MAG: glycoside hydrolase family 3 N-terminal domain-containing protein [Odoribacter splanchnicus]
MACSSAGGKWKSFSGDKVIERKVDSVLRLMTLEEKIGQMTQYSADWDITGPVMKSDWETYLKKGLVGSIFNAVTVDGVRKLQEMALSESRLKIPVLFAYDVVHGFRTIFPMPLAESCSWELDLMKHTASIAATEAAAEGICWTFAPMVDVSRDARWGRVMEGAGEDPWYAGLVAVARVKGFQGENWKALRDTNTVLACAKHFAAYGASEAGRDYNTVDVSERTLYETYFPPFHAAEKAGVATFMTAFNEIGGVPATANHFLYTGVLREQWGFKGFVVTDYTALNELVPHGIAADEKEAAEKAVKAGIDMDMNGSVFIGNLPQLVKEGKVKESTIDKAVRPILEMKFLLGLFEDPYRYLNNEREKNTVMRPEFLQVAREAGRKSIVLLKNDKQVFPIDRNKAQTVALIGPMVMDRINQNGEWAGRGNREQSVSVYQGLTEAYQGSRVKFIYAQGCDLTTDSESGFGMAMDAAAQADVIVAVMGEDFNWSGEAASRTNIQLPGAQQKLLKELVKLGKPVGLILINGRPLDLSWENQQVDAILEAWYLGTMAGYSIADVVSGDYNPSARLTMSFPRNVGQLPLYYNHKNTGRPVDPTNPGGDYRSFYLDAPNSPLYPFGYGLSYTTFEIRNLKMNTNVLREGEKIRVTAEVVNTGNRDGEQVVQMYIRDISGSVTRPVKELRGFQKLALKAGETRNVEFLITPETISMYNLKMEYGPEPGDFKVWIAANAEDESNEGLFSYR